MRTSRTLVTCLFTIIGVGISSLWAQSAKESKEIPAATQWLLDAAGPTQRNSIKSIFLLKCPATQMQGTSFLLTTGIVVSNEHVVHGCTEHNLFAITPLGKYLTFSKVVTDPVRDLAALRPTEKQEGGLDLATKEGGPSLGEPVTTWGFPLIYDGPAPILSVGYVAGYRAAPAHNSFKTVKHMIVNGAFNYGNSGGPVFAANDNKVVGIVVWKTLLFSDNVTSIINGFKNAQSGVSGVFRVTQPDGTQQSVTNEVAIGAVLDEFYKTVQVVIGEAISVSELKDFLTEQEKNLR